MNKRLIIGYGIALIVACLIVGAGVAFTRHTFNQVQSHFGEFKQKLKAQKAAGQLSPEWQNVDLDNLQFENVGMKMSTDEQIRLDIAMWLADFWIVFVMFVFALCIGVAALIGWLSGRRIARR